MFLRRGINFLQRSRFSTSRRLQQKIDIVFLGDNEILPTASTCSLVMRIPTCHNSNEKFNEMMLLGLQGGIEFGSV